MESIKNIFEKEKECLRREHEDILKALGLICQKLEREYQTAYAAIQSGQYYVNQTFIKQTVQAIDHLNAIININVNKFENEKTNPQVLNSKSRQGKNKTRKQTNGSNQSEKMERNPYLIDISLKENSQQLNEQFTTDIDISTFLTDNRQNSHISLTKRMLESNNPVKISIHCIHLTSLQLKSHPYKKEFMINEVDIEKILLFNRLTTLNLSGSSVSDRGMASVLDVLIHLKELNISDCCLLTDQTIKKLSGDKFVNLKLNALNSVSEEAVLSLIVHSYNLNYLEIKVNISLIEEWLEVSSDIGIDLFINKLAYLTHLTSAESITDREVAVLLGDGKSSVNGLFFCCCEDLNQKTVKLICSEINNLKRLKLSKFIRLNDSHVNEIVNRFSELQFFQMEECFSLTNNSLKFISKSCQKLKYLNLSWCRAITDEGIQILCQSQHLQLECIDLSNLKFITDEGVKSIAKNFPSLKSLIIQKCDHVTDEAIIEVSQRLSLLKDYCQNLTDSSLSLVATRLRNLVRLEIEWCQVTQKCVEYIAENLKNLKVLNLNFCPSVCDNQIYLIADNINSKLQVLKLESCDKISSEAFSTLSHSSNRLKYLDLRQCIGVTDEVMKSFCQSSQSHIKFIDLSWCSKITDKTLFSISQYQHQLSFLNLSGCSEITDIGVQWIITTLKNLEFLNLSLCEKITDKSVCMISELKKLRKLYLCELKKISDVSISNLSDLTGLEELHISGCSEVSSSSLLAILHNLEKLSSLNINECSNIRSEFLSIMLDKIGNIRKLELSSLEIDDQFLQNLGKNLQKMQYLNVSMCGKITDQGLTTLVEQVPSLLKVDFQNTGITSRTRQKIVHILNCRRLYNITMD